MKALITQREQIDSHGVLIDVLESTYLRYFERLGLDLFCLSNFTGNLEETLKENQFNLIILTGGGSIPSKFYTESYNNIEQVNRDKLEWRLMEYSLETRVPILGICRGMQYINVFLRGKLTKLLNLKEERPIGEEHLIILGNESKIYVNNYHNDGIDINDLGRDLEPIGLDIKNNIVESFYSKKLKWLGVQWHPERNINDQFSKRKSDRLIEEFIENGGNINESYYLSSGARNEIKEIHPKST